MIIKVKNTVPWRYDISDLSDLNVLWEKLEKTNQKEFIIKKVLKRKGGRLHVKWKIYDHSFNSWIV